MRSKELRAKRAKLIEDARLLIEGDNPAAENIAKFDAAMAEADALKAQIDRLELADTRTAEYAETLRNSAAANGTEPEQEHELAILEESAFQTWMRRGPTALSDKQRPIYQRCCFEAPSSEGAGGWRIAGHDPKNAARIAAARTLQQIRRRSASPRTPPAASLSRRASTTN